jgi:hypothetical protein
MRPRHSGRRATGRYSKPSSLDARWAEPVDRFAGGDEVARPVGVPSLAARADPSEVGREPDVELCAPPVPSNPNSLLAWPDDEFEADREAGVRRWRELDGITRIDGRERWFLPCSPRSGAVRNAYAPPGRGSRLFAAVEVAGLLRSDDGGRSWLCESVDGDDGSGSKPITRARRSSRPHDRTSCSPARRRGSAAVAGSSSPPTTATHGTRRDRG